MKALVMETQLEDWLAVSKPRATRSREWMHRIMRLLEAAVGQLHDLKHPAQGTLLEAASLLRQQIHPAGEVPNRSGRLLAWQARKVHDYIDSHITEPVLVADLCALVRRSEAHFSRSFKRTFGESPHSFVVRRRVELAARYMLTTDASLSDIALRCGFSDQAHLCRHFRQAMGQTPAAWRRVHRLPHDENPMPPVGSFGTLAWLMSLGVFDQKYATATANSKDEHAYIDPDPRLAEAPMGLTKGVAEKVAMTRSPGRYKLSLLPLKSCKPEWEAN
jgi:AraC family transcriptional regulator